MKIRNFLKNNLRLVLFVIGVIGITGYLFVATFGEKSKTTTAPPVTEIPAANPTTDSTTTSGEEVGEEAEVDGEAGATEEPVENFVTEEMSVENRPSVVVGDPVEISGHEKVADNGQYQLFLKEDTLSIILREKQSGAVMYSTVEKPDKSNEKWRNFVQSPVVVEYLVGTNIVYSQADMFTKGLEKTIEKTVDGFTAHLNFKELQISFDVTVTLNDKGLNVLVPEDSVKEGDSKFKIGNLYLYPFLGYSKMAEEEGYLFIPDGSGALISLEDHHGQYSQPYSESVYGTNYGIDDPYVLSLKENQVTTSEPNAVTAPIFGMVHTKKQLGYLAVIEGGDYNAKIEAYPNGAILPYNWTAGKFIYRQFFNQSTSKDSGTMVVRQKNRNSFDAQIQYNFVSGGDADYVGLAKSYRAYLQEKEVIKTKDTAEVTDFKMRLDFLGGDLKKGLISDEFVAMTSFEETAAILAELAKGDVKDLEVVLKGWQEKGIYGGYAQDSYNAASELGGNGGLNRLLKDYQNQLAIHLYDDPLRFNSTTQNSTWFNLVTKLNKRTLQEEVHGSRFTSFNFLQPEDSAKLFEARVDSNKVTDYRGILLDGITNHLFAYSAKGKEYGREDTLKSYQALLEKVAEKESLMLTSPIQPFWQYADSLTDVPVSSSNYVFEDQEIPFFAIAMRGLVTRYSEYGNFVANKQEYKLKLIEQGVYPSYLLTAEDPAELNNTNSSDIYSSCFDNYKAEITEIYQELKAVNEEIGATLIADYQKVGDHVTVTYENGRRLLVNYGSQTAEINGSPVEAYSYKVVSE